MPLKAPKQTFLSLRGAHIIPSPLRGGAKPNPLPLEGGAHIIPSLLRGELNQIPSPLRGEGKGGGEKWTRDE